MSLHYKIASLAMICTHCHPLSGCILSDLKGKKKQEIMSCLSVLTEDGLNRILSYHESCPYQGKIGLQLQGASPVSLQGNFQKYLRRQQSSLLSAPCDLIKFWQKQKHTIVKIIRKRQPSCERGMESAGSLYEDGRAAEGFFPLRCARSLLSPAFSQNRKGKVVFRIASREVSRMLVAGHFRSSDCMCVQQ